MGEVKTGWGGMSGALGWARKGKRREGEGRVGKGKEGG